MGEGGITIDWEHEGYKWFDPEEVTDDESFQGVPRLKESLRRVWFDIDLGKDAGGALAAGLRALQDDHESGARQLASTALDIYLDVIPRIETSDRDTWWKNVRFAGWHLWKNGRESMGAPILSVILSSLDIIEKKLQLATQDASGTLSKDFIQQVCAAIKQFGQERQQSGTKIAHAFASFLQHNVPSSKPLKIVTLSSSSTITSSITHVLASTSRPLDIHVLESRPLFEGVKAARHMSSLIQNTNGKSTVSIHTDASAALASEDADVLLLGADLIDESGNVSNKTGSLPAVLAAKHVSPGVKVVVLSEKEKVLPFEPPGHEENEGEELVRGWREMLGSDTGLQGLSVKNVYFEWVPARLVDVYLTEDGAEGTEHVEAWAREVRRKAGRFFDHL